MRPTRRILLLLFLHALLMGGPAACALGWNSHGEEDAAVDIPDDEAAGDSTPDIDPDTGCPSGWMDCGGTCTDVRSDVVNCGGCGVVCSAGLNADALCEDGLCATRCHPGWSDMDGDGNCESPCTPAAETCNGLDDDCNGECDDGTGMACCAGQTGSCTTSCGSSGTRTCLDTCVWGSCDPPPETCNGTDDDCTGGCDDGFECCAGSTGSCTTSCGGTGTRTCSSSCSWGACGIAAETCNGADDDCDTVCDNGFSCCRGATESCATSCSSTGSRTCSSSCSWGSCTAPAETCNGSDDDCDGSVDEGFRVEALSTTYTAMSGYNSTCNGTTERWGLSCNNAIYLYCAARSCGQSGFGPVENYGDGLDIACTAGGEVATTSFTQLASHHSGCTSSAPVSTDCNAAINRFCQSRSYVSGYGPVYVSGSTVRVTCVSGAVRLNTTYAVLSSHHPDCDGTTQLIGPACSAAAKRYCSSQGHTSGFGPVEMSSGNCTVVCVDP